MNPLRVSFTLTVLSAVLGGPLRAETPAAPPATPKESSLQHRSTFSSPTAGTRNPFLPIGYVRPTTTAPKEVVPTVTAEQFVVTSFSLDPPPLAVINGRTYSVGEKVFLNPPAQTEFVTVRKIADGVVELDHRGRLLRCVAQRRGAGAK